MNSTTYFYIIFLLILTSCSSSDSGNNINDLPPVITLLDEKIVTHEAGTTYADAGASATDSPDGNLTSNIVTVNNVNASVIGSYTVTYDVADSAGNAATQVTRTINVVDTTNPEITLTGATTITLEAGTSYADAGASATDSLDGNLTSNIVTVNNVNSLVVGSYTVTYNVTDSAGNAATQVTRTVSVVDWIPADFSAKEHNDLEIALTWTEDAAITYNIYRSSDQNCNLDEYSVCANSAYLLDKNTGFSDSGLTDEVVYYYWLEAKQGLFTIRSTAPENSTAFLVTTLTTNLQTYVKDTLPYIGTGTGGYIIPTAQDLTAFDETITALMSRQLSATNIKAATVDLELINVVDTVNNSTGDVYCLREDVVQGRGFYCVDFNNTKALHISAPHPKHDTNTNHESVAVAQGTGAKYISVSTTHRCANAANSSCSGVTTACGVSGPFKVSDMAHNIDTFFHKFAIKVYTQETAVKMMQLHGCGATACPSNGDNADIVARLSAGTTSDLPGTELVNQLKTELATTVTGLIGASVKSCSEAGEGDRQLCATTNVTGRYINGEVADPCQTAATTFTDSRFLHIEQNFDLRLDSGGGDTIKSSILIDAINSVVP